MVIKKSSLYTFWREQIVTNYRFAWSFVIALVVIRLFKAILSHF